MATHAKPTALNTNSNSSIALTSNASQKVGGKANGVHHSLEKAVSLIGRQDYAGAAALLHAAGYDAQVRNTLGVCLLRMGNVNEAVNVFRQLVLMPGSVLERPEISNACKRNFATALLMKGFPSGAIAVLDETHEPDHLMAVRIYSAIRQWEATLPWFRRLDWKWNRIEPPNCHVPIDFEPGELEFDVVQRPGDKPARHSWKLAA